MNRINVMILIIVAGLATGCASNGKGDVANKKANTQKMSGVDDCRQSGSRLGRQC